MERTLFWRYTQCEMLSQLGSFIEYKLKITLYVLKALY